MVSARRARDAQRAPTPKEREMAVNVERDPMVFAIEDDPMRAPAPQFVASVRTTAAVSLMLALPTVTLLLLGIGDAGAHAGLIKIAGWFGIATAAVGLCAALITSTYERTLLPLRAVRHVR
jgi:hypothetical protein